MSDINTQKLAMIENQLSNFDRYFEKIDHTLDRLTDLSSSIEKILAVHEQRLNDHSDDINAVQTQINEIHNRFDRLRLEREKIVSDHESRFRDLERWRWLSLGGITVIVFLATNMSKLSQLFIG